MNPKSAMVIGSTGLTGSILLKQLLAADHFDTVISVSRKDPGFVHEKLVKYILDFDRLDEVEELLVSDHIFCCLGTTIKVAGSQEAFRKVDMEMPLEFAQIARKNNSPNFSLVTAMGANPASKVFYNRVKGEVEEEIKKVGFEHLSIFRPSLLLGDREEIRKGERIAQGLSVALPFLFIGPLAKYKPIPAETVASAILKESISPSTGVVVYESPQIFKKAGF